MTVVAKNAITSRASFFLMVVRPLPEVRIVSGRWWGFAVIGGWSVAACAARSLVARPEPSTRDRDGRNGHIRSTTVAAWPRARSPAPAPASGPRDAAGPVADGTSLWRDRTAWSRERAAPLRSFLRTESGSAGVLLAAAVAALVWANIDISHYESFWHARLSVSVGDREVSHDLRTWVNSGLMTLFFLVVGLETRREFDLGDLRERRRFVLPLVAGLVAMALPAAIYLAFNAGGSGAHGWGVAMSTDTALALGLLAMLGRDVPDRVRVFLLTISVVDDLAALVVIALFYGEDLSITDVGIAVVVFAALLVASARRVQRRWVYIWLGLAMWAALLP